MNRRQPSAKSRARIVEREELWADFTSGDDDFVAVDCRPKGY